MMNDSVAMAKAFGYREGGNLNILQPLPHLFMQPHSSFNPSLHILLIKSPLLSILGF